jgi:hypothetical protein
MTNHCKNLTFAVDAFSSLLDGFGMRTGGAGAFFFFRLNVMPSVDDDNEDVEPLKLCPGEFWFDKERGDGSGVAEFLQYLYLSMISLLHFRSSFDDK